MPARRDTWLDSPDRPHTTQQERVCFAMGMHLSQPLNGLVRREQAIGISREEEDLHPFLTLELARYRVGRAANGILFEVTEICDESLARSRLIGLEPCGEGSGLALIKSEAYSDPTSFPQGEESIVPGYQDGQRLAPEEDMRFQALATDEYQITREEMEYFIGGLRYMAYRGLEQVIGGRRHNHFCYVHDLPQPADYLG